MPAYRSLLLFLLLWLFTETANTQVSNILFEKYTTANGLCDNNTNAIIQDSHGFLWIGSNHGVSRYDGRFFKNYSLMGNHGLTDLSVVCLAEDADGNIWIGTQNGLNKLNPYTEIITQYYEGTGPGTIPYKWCNYLYTDRNKKLWLTSEKGIALYNKANDTFLNYPVNVSGTDGRINKFISKIFEDSKGRLWLATSFGIKLFDRESKKYKSYYYKTSTLSAAYPVTSLFESADGSIWAGTWLEGIKKYNESLDRFETQSSDGFDYSKNVVSDIDQGRFRNKEFLMLASSNGLILNDASNRLSHQVSTLTDNISQIFRDKQGNFWITGVGGLYKMNNNSLAFEWMELPGVAPVNNMVYHIIPDCKDPQNTFYLTTLSGWWKYDYQKHTISKKMLPPDPKNLLGGINRWICEDDKYWFTSINGFGMYDSERNSLTDLSSLISTNQANQSSGMIVQDNQNKLWVSLHRSGVLIYDRRTKQSVQLLNEKDKPGSTLGNDIRDLHPGPDGFIYLTSANKLYKINPADYAFSTYSPDLADKRIDAVKVSPDNILFTRDGRIFISSSLLIYEFRNNKLNPVYPKNKYADFSIDKLYGEENGTLWATTSNGVYKTDTSFRNWIHINSRLGWSDDEIITDIIPLTKGVTLFAGKNKIGLLKDSLLNKSTPPPAVILSRIKYGDKEIYLVSDKSTPIYCNYNEPIEIELASIDFNNEKENRIFFQLNGLDHGWKELTGQPVIRYEQLPPGKYIFEARQVNAEGAESAVTKVTLFIPQPFYKSWWFISLLIAIGFGIHFSINHYRKQKAAELEKLRMRIASDLHDDIGATLSSISIYSEALKNQLIDDKPYLASVLEKMGENSREMVTNMSDIVWAINPGNDNGEKLISRMQNYATDICALRNIHLTFYEDKKLKSISLPLEQRKNIYLIFKEAVNNAVKYSEADNIYVSLLLSGNLLTLEVKDDGKGFNESAIEKGNGLKNIKNRALELKAQISITSAENEGTLIHLKWKLE